MKPRLRATLDPRGLRVLKKRLVNGQITPQVFKDILKRQMIKQYFQNQSHTAHRAWKRGKIRSIIQMNSRNGAIRPADQESPAQPTIEIEELFSMGKTRHF